MDILSKEEVYEIDQSLMGSGLTLDALIFEVGENLSNWFVKNKFKNKKILILCGPGNNGKDGMALAYYLDQLSFSVEVFIPELHKVASGSTTPNLYKKIEHLVAKKFQPKNYSCIVDALFGVGLSKPLKSPYEEIVKQSNEVQASKIAIDIPSGVETNSGELYSPCFKAEDTLTVACLKRGLVLMPGLKCVGRVHVIPVKTIANELSKKSFFCKTLVPQKHWKPALTPSKESHKYKRGKVSLVLGEKFPGASLLAAQSARNAGAGYTQVYCPLNMLKACQVQHPGLVFHSYDSLGQLEEKLDADDAQVLLMGPGWTENFSVRKIIKPETIYIFDGGLLNDSLIRSLKETDTSRVILTPHAGELERLVGCSLSKWESLQELSKSFLGVIVAKGYDTIAYKADENAFITTSNSPFLATAGSGDVLAGLIAGVCSQGLGPLEGSCCGVYLHQYLGDSINYGTTAERIIEEIPEGIRNLF